MVLELYAIRDLIAHEFGPIFGSKNENTARRSFNNTIKEESRNEFALYRLGDIDTDTGVIRPTKAIVEIDDEWSKNYEGDK